MQFGHLESSIAEMLHGETCITRDSSVVLITCLDSVHDLAASAIGTEVLKRFPDCRVLGSGLLLPGALVRHVHGAQGLFSGFDELWCFNRAPCTGPPEQISVRPPPDFGSEAPSPDVLAWMHANACALALGDGFGLNFVARDREDMEALQQALCRGVN
jgi:hypothetical protein